MEIIVKILFVFPSCQGITWGTLFLLSPYLLLYQIRVPNMAYVMDDAQ